MEYHLYHDGIGKIEYVDHVGTDLTIVNAARVSFGKHKEVLEETDKKLIRYLIKNRHTSTLEHNFVTFRIKVPLFVARQHMRHRTWKFNEVSRRYTEENIEFYSPKEFRTQHESNRQASATNKLINPLFDHNADQNYYIKCDERYREHCEDSFDLYTSFLEMGVCREQARALLPQAMYTEYYASVDLNNLLKFIELRIHKHAQWEIQKLAHATLKIAKELWPVTIDAYMEIRNINGD